MLADEFGLTHQELADAVGRSRSAVSNAMRLLELNEDVRVMVENGDIEMGHARALLALCGAAQSKAAEEVVRRNLTARETESLVRRLTQPETAPTPKVRDRMSSSSRTIWRSALAQRCGFNTGPRALARSPSTTARSTPWTAFSNGFTDPAVGRSPPAGIGSCPVEAPGFCPPAFAGANNSNLRRRAAQRHCARRIDRGGTGADTHRSHGRGNEPPRRLGPAHLLRHR